MTNSSDTTAPQRWVAYRPDIKILDCSIRDGGLINDHQFDVKMVRKVYKALVAGGVDYMEFGYKASNKIFSPDEFGRWKFCTEDDLRAVVGDAPDQIKVTVMADAERTDYHNDILPCDQSVIDVVRVACYIHQIPTALDMIQDAHDKGYETFMQLMAVSTVNGHEILSALELAARSPAQGVYLVDSFGGLYSEQIRDLIRIYKKAMEGTGKEIGFHAHNNLQLAFANTIEAIISGATMLDATMCGIGRGAGNCPMELLMGFLHNPKFSLRPILECSQDVFVPLRKQIDWGYSIPYAITGQLNEHPRDAIKLRAGDTPDDYVGFYDQMID